MRETHEIPRPQDLDWFDNNQLGGMLKQLQGSEFKTLYKYIRMVIERRKKDDAEIRVYTTEDAFKRIERQGFIDGLTWILDVPNLIEEELEDRIKTKAEAEKEKKNLPEKK